MQDQKKTQELDLIPDEESFHRALAQIEAFGRQTFEIANHQQDLIQTLKERNVRDVTELRKRIDEKNSEIDQLRKGAIDVRMQLSETRRNENSLRLEVKQLQEQLAIYRVDTSRIDKAEKQFREAREESARLRSYIENLKSEAAKADRDRRSELDALKLKYEQEKVHLQENIQIATDRAKNSDDAVQRVKVLMAIAEKEKKAAYEELSRGKQTEKEQVEKLRSELAQRTAEIAEGQQALSSMQRDYERKLAIRDTQAEQDYQTQIENLRHELEDRNHEIGRLRYQLDQLKEDHRREIDALKQDMARQLEIRADEIRRQLMLKNTGADPTNR